MYLLDIGVLAPHPSSRETTRVLDAMNSTEDSPGVPVRHWRLGAASLESGHHEGVRRR